jgi:hypothetical protein
VQHEDDEQADFRRHDERIRDEGVRVLVENLWTRKNQRIPGEMQDQVGEQRQPRQPDEHLGSDRGGKYATESRHQGGSVIRSIVPVR